MAVLLLDWLVRASIVLLVAWLVAAALARSSAAARAAVWRGAFVAVLLLPLASATLPPLRWLPTAGRAVTTTAVPSSSPGSSSLLAGEDAPVERPLSRQEPTRSSAPDGPRAAATESRIPSRSLSTLLVGLWALGAVVSLVGLARGLWLAGRIVRAAEPLDGDPGRRVTDAACAPFVWDLRPLARPVLLLRRGEERDRAVLLHEEAHVVRLDGPVLLLARVIAACAWPTPLAWVALRGLRLETERACDDAVLRGGVRASDYAVRLVVLASARPAVALPTMAAGDVTRRVEALLIPERDRRPLTWPTAALGAGAALVLCALIASAAPAAHVPQEQEETEQYALRPERTQALSRALDRLVELQGRDGAWKGDVGYKLNHSWRVTSAGVPHVGVTGLAVEALARAGQEPGSGPTGVALQRGVAWLLSTQQTDGGFRAHGTRLRSHAYALGALAVVERLHPSDELKAAVERGLLYSLDAQGPEGWRFEPGAADADVLETAHQLAAVWSARSALPRTERLEAATAEARRRATTYAAGLRVEVPDGAYRYQRSEHARVTANTTTAGWLLRCLRGTPPQDPEEWKRFEEVYLSLMQRLAPNPALAEHHFLTWDARLLARRVGVLTHWLVDPVRPEVRAFTDQLAQAAAQDAWRCDEGPGEAYFVAIAALVQGRP